MGENYLFVLSICPSMSLFSNSRSPNGKRFSAYIFDNSDIIRITAFNEEAVNLIKYFEVNYYIFQKLLISKFIL